MKIKKKNKLIILIIFLLFTISSFAQDIKGVILDKNSKEPIIGAHIYQKNKKKGSISNSDGRFIFKLKSKTNKSDTLFISHISYVIRKVTISELKTINNIIYLKPDVQQLERVSISFEKHLRSNVHFNKLSPLEEGLYSFGSLINDNSIYVIGGDASNKVDTYRKALALTADNYIAPTLSDFSREVNGISPSYRRYNSNLLTYDIKANAWKTSNLEFRKRTSCNVHFFNNKIYVIGGKRFSSKNEVEYLDDKIEVFDLKNSTILIDDTNPHQAVNFASFLYNDNLIVLGGSIKKNKKGIKEYSDKIHLYDLKSGYWYKLGEMPTPKETKGVLIDDIIYLIGGFNNKALDEIQSFNLKTGKWKKEGELFKGIDRPALAYKDNVIYIFENGSLLTYNIKTKKLDEYSIRLFLKSSELFYKNNKLYLLGGYIEDKFSKKPSRDLFSIDLNEFEKTRIKNSKRF